MNIVKFGDVVQEIKNNVDRNNNPYEFFVAGDHMDTEELYIKRRGTFKGSDVGPAFTRIFKPGQVLYGSRRTYLKKVAMADFEGITANTTFILESKDENKLLTRLLPFIMYSDKFTQYSISKSKGSTNPYILFKDLAAYEFNLPSLEEQKKLAETLWQIVSTMESYKKLLSKTDEMVKAKFVEMFGTIDNSKWMCRRLGELCKISSGYAFKSDKFQNKGVPVLRIGNINSGILKKDNLVFWPDDTSLSKYILYPGDLAMSLTGTVGKDDYGNICILNDEYPKYYLNQRNAKFSDFDDKLNKLYLAYYFKLPLVKKTLTNSNHGVRQANILNKDLENILLPLPPITLQNEYVNFVTKSEESKSAIQASLDSLKQVYKKIITENLGGK